jgi:hypothetical protein
MALSSEVQHGTEYYLSGEYKNGGGMKKPLNTAKGVSFQRGLENH